MEKLLPYSPTSYSRVALRNRIVHHLDDSRFSVNFCKPHLRLLEKLDRGNGGKVWLSPFECKLLFISLYVWLFEENDCRKIGRILFEICKYRRVVEQYFPEIVVKYSHLSDD